jgi:hypothetical protein
MLALACRLAVSDDGRSEAGEHQGADEILHDVEIAAQQPGGVGEKRCLVVVQKIEWQLPVRCVEQQVRQQPVGLCRGAAKAVAESRRGSAAAVLRRERRGRRTRRPVPVRAAIACGRAR